MWGPKQEKVLHCLLWRICLEPISEHASLFMWRICLEPISEHAPLFIVTDLFGTHQWTGLIVYCDGSVWNPSVNMPHCLLWHICLEPISEHAPLFIVTDLFGTQQWTCPVVYFDGPVWTHQSFSVLPCFSLWVQQGNHSPSFRIEYYFIICNILAGEAAPVLVGPERLIICSSP